MSRASLITAFALSVVAPASSVAADDCMCFGMPDLVRVDQSFEVGPFFSSDGVALSSRLELEHGRGTPLNEILWCWSANDPRCSPGDPAPNDAPAVVRHAPSAEHDQSVSRWPLIEGADSLFRRADLAAGPRSGVRVRVERPPRA